MAKTCYIFVGRSGCGKGTQAKRLIKEKLEERGEQVYYLESGDNFRKFIQGDKYSNQLSKKIYESGALQPEFLAVWVWSHLLVENLQEGQTLVLDGTPRKLRESHVLDSALSFYGYDQVYVIYINISKEESKKRLAARGRLDDINPAEVEKRMGWFDSEVMPVIEDYRDNDKYHFIEVNGEQEIDDTFADLLRKLAN